MSEINKLLKKLNLPKFNSNLDNYDLIKYFVMKNDEDGNYDTQTNVGLIKSCDYGYPVNYNSKYLINNYEFCNNENKKKDIETAILESIDHNLSQLFYQ